MDKDADKFELVQVAMKDIDLLFEWANDSECRKNAFNSENIEYEEHKKWFLKKLNDDNCKIYLYVYNKEAIGQVRVDIQGTSAFIDYSIKKEYRGKGHGINILQLLEEKILQLKNSKIRCLVGEVKTDNLASQKVFEKLAYSGEKKDDYVSYKKLLMIEE
jgi:spore coat polysaccharide biosynthesis protein SpsF